MAETKKLFPGIRRIVAVEDFDIPPICPNCERADGFKSVEIRQTDKMGAFYYTECSHCSWAMRSRGTFEKIGDDEDVLA